jgi:uracil-DNA glycosylase
VLVWNCVPFHPHHAGQPRSIRTPTLTEVRHYAPLLLRYVEILRPRQVVAIGNHAARSLGEMGIAAEQVRHPSHGGVPKFKQGIRRVLRQLRPR